MKRLMMAALAAGSLAIVVPGMAFAAMPGDIGGSPGNGQAAVNGQRDQGGSPGNGQAATSNEKDQGGTPGNGNAKKKD